jgi:hypothetical protein
MVMVAQLVESRIVIPVVAGSNPVLHPKYPDGEIGRRTSLRYWIVESSSLSQGTNAVQANLVEASV